ncbi:MAG: GAF domain-containing protein [Chloroflexi bacterium]|nr:MAG: GAF domain-containing protein [Chloroflexota bacterium]
MKSNRLHVASCYSFTGRRRRPARLRREPRRGAVARLVPRKKVTERDVAVSKPPVGNVVVSKIMTYNVGHVTADPEIQLLNRLGGLFSASLSLNENIEAMLRATSQMVQFDAATVFLLNEGSRELTATATYPHRDMVPHIARFVLGDGILGYAVEQLETLNIADATLDPRFKMLDQSRSPRSLMVQPLATTQRVVGAMTISRQRVDPFTELDAAILKVITNQASIAIENGRLYEQLQAHLGELETAGSSRSSSPTCRTNCAPPSMPSWASRSCSATTWPARSRRSSAKTASTTSITVASTCCR